MLRKGAECMGHQLFEHGGRYSTVVSTQLRRRHFFAHFYNDVPAVEKQRNVRPDAAIRDNHQSFDPYLVYNPPVLPVQGHGASLHWGVPHQDPRQFRHHLLSEPGLVAKVLHHISLRRLYYSKGFADHNHQ